MSNKFALSDNIGYCQKRRNVALVSWVDTAKFASLVIEIFTQSVDRALAQSVDSMPRSEMVNKSNVVCTRGNIEIEAIV